ncbi:MAG: glycosyltransferase family A protein [Candidatus Sedimenticola sp. (ex Thyasira tokunagai)]
MGKLVSIVIFVHNEEEALPNFLRELANQRLSLDHYRFNLFFACNGCNDNSVKLCEEASDNFADLFESYIVYDWSEPSKSMAWNRSVRLLQEQNSPDFIVFMDSDISIESATCIEDLLREFSDDKCQIVTSKPVKQFSSSTPWFLKVASKIVGNKHQDGAVCGQLYAARASAVHDLYLPVPCLVEDGFIAATMVTNYFTENPDPSYVRASKRAWHFLNLLLGCLISLITM